MVLSRGNKTTPFKAFSLNKKTWKDWGDNDYLPPKWKRCLNAVSCLSGDLPLWPTIPCERIFVSDKYIQNFERTYKTAAAEAYQKTLLKEGLGSTLHPDHAVSPKKKKF